VININGLRRRMDCRILTNGLDSKRKKNIKKKVFEERFEESMQY